MRTLITVISLATFVACGEGVEVNNTNTQTVSQDKPNTECRTLCTGETLLTLCNGQVVSEEEVPCGSTQGVSGDTFSGSSTESQGFAAQSASVGVFGEEAL